MKRLSLLSMTALFGVVIMGSVIKCIDIDNKQGADYSASAQYSQGKFINLVKDSTQSSFTDMLASAKRYFFAKSPDSVPSNAIPVQAISRDSLDKALEQGDSLYRLGHSSILLSLAKQYWLIDPVLGERASPVSWAGPKRFHKSPIAAADLPQLKGVIISHDHYDHLDKVTIQAIKDNTEFFIVPLGVGKHLQAFGVDKGKIHELDWWQQVSIDDVKVTAAPAQHFSGRGLRDRDNTLWASWAIETGQQKIFYSGDSGYFDGFKTIGERLGPFDLSIMENGAYDQSWANVHMTPEQSFQAHKDVQAKTLLPVHNSTFDLALHAWTEPLTRLLALAKQDDQSLLTPIIGQQVKLSQLEQAALNSQAWWQMTTQEGVQALAHAQMEPRASR
jgi:L-ascorbate metabolism protein UlaG (beta-lactamase superfamily)